MNEQSISKADYDYLAKLLEKVSGLSLGSDKEYLVTSRLKPLCHSLSLDGVSDLVKRLSQGSPDPKLVKVINELMTTNESFFFRDQWPFEILTQKLVPEFLRAREATKRIHIWSAACSLGQEPYSIAMALLESKLIAPSWKVQILATDFSEPVLARAREGLFAQHEVIRGLSPELLKKYFVQEGHMWRVVPEIRTMIDFKYMNLLEPLPTATFDVVFMRNVLIYFSHENKAGILGHASRMAAKDAVLILGSTETAFGITDKWKPIPDLKLPIYRKV